MIKNGTHNPIGVQTLPKDPLRMYRSEQVTLRTVGPHHCHLVVSVSNSQALSGDALSSRSTEINDESLFTIRLKPFQRLTRDDFLEDFQINFLGAVHVIQACLPNLKKSPTGASILLFSTVAVTTGMPFHASIAGAKGAVEGLTRSLAAELASRIRVNAIAPSLTDTPLAVNLLSSEEKRQAAAERHPMKRIGSVQDIARLALFLLSDDAGWITGQVFHADGGMSALRTFK